MRKMMAISGAAAILIGAAMAPVAASGENGAQSADRAGSQARGTDHKPIVLRRDGDRAAPFDPVIAARPVSSTTAAQPGDFGWRDAAIGAAAVGLILLASATAVAVHRRRQPGRGPSVAA